ncbi:sigma-70 family RNA polymerase sigma factor [Paenibacillus sp. JX-17]|uniref:Sigma-70 family RNA polymerase sigma factor n=1 Tax=Paenibacillus lacisoli TaxID=3064525 RepID=A0ABT9CD27_9BACL|nr:sigma-70 family RNA polymerase sigma factor [Paenibacillus sp. JX-17]MDO7907173.1 sigma-70 family RNA polymerase sigma factor [Paenibacillus sp. JX-17]
MGTEKNLQQHDSPSAGKDTLLASFFAVPEHRRLFHEVQRKPNNENRQQLDEAFRIFFFDIRFRAYISMLVHYYAVGFDRRERRERSRYELILDQPVQPEEGGTSRIELMADPISENGSRDQEPAGGVLLEDMIGCESLYVTLKKLTLREKEVITAAYVSQQSDTEIAGALGITQQAVSKTRSRAIRKLREAYVKRGG